MIRKLLDILNIHADKNQKLLLWSMAISGLLITYIHPATIKAIITELPAEWLAFNSLVSSISCLTIGMLWKDGVRSKAIRYFAVLAITESICGFLLALYLCFVEFNAWIYAIATLIYTNIVSFFVGKCVMAFKAKLWIEKDREVYDNNASIVGGMVCIVGYVTALLAMPSIKLSMFLWAICCIVDDIGWVIVYLRNKEILKEC